MKTLGKIAIYQGTEYEFRKKTDGSYALYSDDLKSLEIGFRRSQVTKSMTDIFRYLLFVKILYQTAGHW